MHQLHFILIIISTFILCSICPKFGFAQISDYHQIELNGGSKFIGKIIDKNKYEYLLETNLIDTLHIKRSAIKRIFLIQQNHNAKADVPVLMNGIYKSFTFGVGSGSRVTNPQWLANTATNFVIFSVFNPPNPALLTPQSTLLSVYRIDYTLGYQLNRYFGLGIGMNIDALAQDELLTGNVVFERANLNPYFQGKFNYPLSNWGNKDIWMTLNAFRHTEIATGLTFYNGNSTYKVGLSWYKSYFAFKTENYFSLNVGFQF